MRPGSPKMLRKDTVRMTRQAFLLAGFAIVLTWHWGSSSTKQPPNQSGAWNIGPVINGRNYSPGMPPSSPDGALTFPVGYPNSDHAVISSVHYVTRPLGLIGKTRVRMTFEIIGSGPFK